MLKQNVKGIQQGTKLCSILEHLVAELLAADAVAEAMELILLQARVAQACQARLALQRVDTHVRDLEKAGEQMKNKQMNHKTNKICQAICNANPCRPPSTARTCCSGDCAAA